MRTTLKRGIGRGAAPNGNGRAVLPPATVGPVTLYRAPEPAKRSRWALLGAIVLWTFASLLMVGVGLVGGAYLYFHEKVSEIQTRTPEARLAASRLDVVPPGKPAVALVIGYDKRTAGPEKDLPALSDTIMLVRADPETDALSMLSFPRDLIVNVQCPGKGSYVGKINSAYSECGGPVGTLETVRALTGVPINYLITVNFRGFKRVVNKLGGVWVDVDRRYLNDNSSGFGTYATIDLRPGYQRLRGADALDFVRYRHTDSDFHRIARQQSFVKAFKQQVTSSFSPFKLPSLIDAVTSNVEVGRAGGKPIDGGIIKSYAFFLFDLPSGHFFQSKIEGIEGYAELTTAPANIEAAVADFMNPDVNAPEKAAAVALGRKLKASGPRPQNVSISVLNGNGRTGSASNASFELAKRGYRIVTGETANAPSFEYFHTKVYFDPSQKGSKAAARAVRNLFGTADVERIPLSLVPLANGGMLTVVVGETFHERLAPTPVDKTPEKEPPAVVANPDATEPLLRDVRRRVRFQLMVPRVIERTSTVDSEAPIRVYRMTKGHRAVRLTFKTSSDSNEYWGIEQTDWADAPILESPNVSQVIRGRRFDLYYSGPRLHMVVLRANGATYWVVNTLLDKLSNDTMLSIAKGLRPLGGK